MFSKAQLDRYARHIMLPGVGAAGQQRLLDASVLVVGAGGLGSPVLLYLAAAGVGRLGIADFDTVELSNLQRQVLHSTATVGQAKTQSAKDQLESLNPDPTIQLHPERLTSANARAICATYDLVIDGSDNFPTRYLLNDACVLEGKALLYGAMSQFEGQLSLFNTPSATSPCYRCLFPAPPAAGTIKSCAEAGVFGALPGVIGSMMAVEAIKHIVGLGDSLTGTLLHYDALYNDTYRVHLRKKIDCPVCGATPTVTDLIDYLAFCGESVNEA